YLVAAAIQQDGGHLGGRLVAARQPPLLIGVDLLGVPCGPLPAHPFAEPPDVSRADRHLGQFLEVVSGLAERRRLAALADDLAEQTGAIALRAQLQALVQRGKKRPDRSHTTTARVGTPPSRPTSGAAGAAKGARVAYGAGPVGHTWGNREGPGPQGAPGR